MILSIQNVVKRYDKHMAVDHVSFDIPRGCVFGLLGPNGAGKTSLIRMITTITAPDEGAILLDGQRLNERSPEQIGYMPEERGLYKKMKVGEHLLYLAQLKGLSEAEARKQIGHWLEKFEIQSWWNKKIEELSKGMQQKIQFIATIVHKPRLLILDEPFTGLDPINTNLIKDEIAQLNAAVVQMDQVTLQNAAIAEESAAEASDIHSQAQVMVDAVVELRQLCGADDLATAHPQGAAALPAPRALTLAPESGPSHNHGDHAPDIPLPVSPTIPGPIPTRH